MNNCQIGENAGIVWRVLHDRRHSWEELVKITELHPLELASAIGWLAREDKIRFLPERGIMYLRYIMNAIIERDLNTSGHDSRHSLTCKPVRAVV